MPNSYYKRAVDIAEKAVKLKVWSWDFARRYMENQHDDENLTFWEEKLEKIEKEGK